MHTTQAIWVLVALGMLLMSTSGVVLDSILPGEQMAGYGKRGRDANCGSYRRRLVSNWQVTLLRSEDGAQKAILIPY